MKRSAPILTILVFAALLACSGCALVPIPFSRTLPDPIRQIDVVQVDTGQPISNAVVVMRADRFKNWIRSFPPHYANIYTPPAETSIVVRLEQEETGHFMPERRRVWRYVRPWGIGPLGTTIHEDYAVTISVRADGYIPVTATYWPGGRLNPEFGGNQKETDFRFPQFGTNGTLTVFLNRKNAGGPANGSQPSRPE